MSTPYSSTQPAGRDGFLQLVRGEWTKFRTVRGWVVGTVVAAVVMVALGVLTAAGSTSTIATPEHPEGVPGHPDVPIGPDGTAVSDQFSFVHRALSGDGSITARVDSLNGGILQPDQGGPGQPPQPPKTTGGVQPWAKAGLIVKTNTDTGSAYAAIMVTAAHGVRMQYNFTGDIAGPSGTPTTWLRLRRAGDMVTGYASADGSAWTTVGTVRLAGLPSTVPAGMFVASPGARSFEASLGGGSSEGGATLATATFDAVDTQGAWAGQNWTGTAVGTSEGGPDIVRLQQTGTAYTMSGSGDISPDVGVSGTTVEHILVGGFAAMTVLVVLAVLFITTEYRRGLIHTSLAASPRRGRLLAAKAVVIGGVTFVAGLVATAAAAPIGIHLLRNNGNFVYPVDALTWLRIIGGTAALLAVAAVLAMAIGTILRRGAAAVAGVIVLVVLPYILATAGVLPADPSRWLLRVTPAAAFAIQQTIPAYDQVSYTYTPLLGFYPLPPWGGFAVLVAWAAAALGLAGYLLRRRDA